MPGYDQVLLYLRMTCVAFAFIVYGFIFWFLQKVFSSVGSLQHFAGIKAKGASDAKKLMKATTTIGICLLNAVFFMLVPDIFLIFDPFGIGSSFSGVFYVMLLTKMIVDFGTPFYGNIWGRTSFAVVGELTTSHCQRIGTTFSDLHLKTQGAVASLERHSLPCHRT